MKKEIFISLVLMFLLVLPLTVTNYFYHDKKKGKNDSHSLPRSLQKQWTAPDTSKIPHTEQGDLIRKGRELVIHTSVFFGPHGSVASISNGMNCENCHMDGGTKPWANNFSSVGSIYPVFKSRRGQIETIEMRINDCFERSLNGSPIPDSGIEMKAMIAYIRWVGKDVNKGVKTKESGTENLPFLGRPADPDKGKIIYKASCETCHGKNGEGKLLPNGKEYLYPPLWGRHSYNTGAGIFRISKFAGYIKNNMPFGVSKANPKLSNEDAWDVAAYVNSKPRPVKYFKMDWPEISSKPFDYPFGPYADSFSVTRHKYGPFEALQSNKSR